MSNSEEFALDILSIPLRFRERLLPGDILIADALVLHGSMKALPLVTGLSRATIKSRLYDIRRKTRCRSTRELATLWPCEIFQLGLRDLGIRWESQRQ